MHLPKVWLARFDQKHISVNKYILPIKDFSRNLICHDEHNARIMEMETVISVFNYGGSDTITIKVIFQYNKKKVKN